MPQVNIDNLTKLAQERNDETAWRALWGAVFKLPAWYAVSDTQRPDAPMVLRLREQPTLALFTDEAKARAFINKGPARGASSTLRLAMPQGLAFLHQLSVRGVTQVVFNVSPQAGSSAFGYGLAGLIQLAAAHGVSIPGARVAPAVPTGDERLDRLVAAMAADPSEARATELFEYVYGLEQWHVIVQGEGEAEAPALTMLNQAPVMLAFTSEGLAQAHVSARNLTAKEGAAAGGGGPVSVRSLPVEQAVGMAEGRVGLSGMVFNDGSQPFFAPTRNLRPMLERFRPASPAS